MNFKVAVGILGTLLLAVGLAATFTPRIAQHRDEAWMEKRVPHNVADYDFRGSANPEQTYKMDPVTYETLNPYGIVCRVFDNGKAQFDTVVIHSNNSDSFHDPRVCFQSQGSELLNQRVRQVDTKTRGSVPVTFIKTSYNGSERTAAYTYRGPSGFTDAPIPLMNDLFLSELKQGTVQTGTFFRFIALNPTTTEDELATFIGQFLDASYESSNKDL